MKGRSIFIDTVRSRPAAALMVDGRLQDLVFDPPMEAAPGAIFRAKIDRVVKGAAFVRLPQAEGYLRGSSARKGETLLVQIVSVAEPGKAVPVTSRLVFKGRAVIVTPGAEGINVSRQVRQEDERHRLLEAVETSKAATSAHGIVVRTAARHCTDADIAEETDRLLERADEVLTQVNGEPALVLPAPTARDYALREWQVPSETDPVSGAGCFLGSGVEEEIEVLRSPIVPLGEASMMIEPTRALVAIDVNTGSDFTPAAGLKTNLAVARELPRQLRLRGLGGKVAVDFAPMPKQQRRTLEEALRKAFRADPVETALVGWTTLGLFEIQRKRERWPLTELL